jgi:hypothetical protein
MSPNPSGALEVQLERLQRSFPDATASPLPDGTQLVMVPGVSVPAGWNRPATWVAFIVPVGYPAARPDCFFADPELRLQGEGMPTSSGQQQIPHSGRLGLWFSWHLATWNPGRDDLATYVGVIRERLSRAQ